MSIAVHRTLPANDLFHRCLRGEELERPPIWLMRQAGRTDPEYNALRERLDLPLEELFRHPVHAATISLLPKRLGVDAIIFFQDILTPLGPMGAPFVFRPGPVTERPVRTPADVERLQSYAVAEHLGFVDETFDRIHDALEGELPVLGFAGAPWTLAVFLIEGASFGTSADRAVDFARQYPAATHALLEKLTVITVDYLHYQMECGAAAVQLFESAAPVVDAAMYREFALPYQQRVFAALRGGAPTINFARDLNDIDLLAEAGANVLSLPSTLSIREVRATLGPEQIVQGNVSNKLLRDGPLEAIESAAKACVDEGGRRGHIFNLDHGLLKETPYEHVQHLVRTVLNY